MGHNMPIVFEKRFPEVANGSGSVSVHNNLHGKRYETLKPSSKIQHQEDVTMPAMQTNDEDPINAFPEVIDRQNGEDGNGAEDVVEEDIWD